MLKYFFRDPPEDSLALWWELWLLMFGPIFLEIMQMEQKDK